MTNKTYDTLKYIEQIVLPALAALWLSIAKIWDLPLGWEIGATVSAVDLFLGAILKISKSNYDETVDIMNAADFLAEITDGRGDDE